MPRPVAPHVTPYAWPALASFLSLIPFVAGFSTTNVFYVRDLAMYFWPRHLWHRRSFRSGDWPWWDPFAGGGQSAVADALNQFFLLPVTVIRVLAPPVTGFNFWVAAPFPILAAGLWFWLRRHVSPAAAFVGAAAATAAGPVLSTGNFPNYSWAVALVPWVLWSVDRLCDAPRFGRFAALAACAGVQSLAGEPVTFASTAALVLGYAVVAVPAAGWRDVAARVLRIGGALATGVLLSAVQLIPLLYAVSRSIRAVDIDETFWSLHPFTLLETVAPHLFGHIYYAELSTYPWMKALNSGREPFFYSTYVGVAAFALAVLGPAGTARRRWRLFWWAVCGLALLSAFGKYTPVYPALQRIVPVLETFRFPAKYLVMCVFAVAALAAAGADALLARSDGAAAMGRPIAARWMLGSLGGVSALVGAASIVQADWLAACWTSAARLLELGDPAGAAGWVIQSGMPLWLRLSAISIVLLFLVEIVWRGHRLAPLAAVAVCAVAVTDPIAVNHDLHPTLPASLLGPPEWMQFTRAHPDDRVYVGGRLRRSTTGDERLHVPLSFPVPIEWDLREAKTKVAVQFALAPAGWGVRELISYDLPQLWSRDYWALLEVFRDATQEERVRFLRRTGTRYCFQSEPPYPGAPLLDAPPFTDPVALYECYDRPRRMYVTEAARVEPNVLRQLALMFDERHDPFRTVLLERDPPAAAGEPGGPAATPLAEVVREGNRELVVQTDIGVSGGYLNVVDSYDPFWIVDVDGIRAPLLRANGVFRAVRLAPGHHEVRFRYRPTPMYAGLGVTVITAAVLLLACWRTSGASRAPRAHTLDEVPAARPR